MDKKKVQKIEEVSKKVQPERQMTIIDVLMDENNREPITLMDATGRKLSLEQIAVIPYKDRLYCVLKPIDKIEGVQDDEAIVFYVDETQGEEPVLMVETDEQVAMDVFDQYYDLLDEEQNKKPATKKPAPKGGKK